MKPLRPVLPDPLAACPCGRDMRRSFSLLLPLAIPLSAAADDAVSPFSYLEACDLTFELVVGALDEVGAAVEEVTVLVDSVSFSELLAAGDEEPLASDGSWRERRKGRAFFICID